jgi:hypothetical protein
MDRGNALDPYSYKPALMKVFMTNETLSLSAIASTCGSKLVEAKGFEAKRQACLEEVNAGVMKLAKAKAKVGQNKKCSIATSFYDALVQGGLGKGTAANYLSTFRKAVAEGKPVKEWNPAQSKGKASAGSSAKGTKGKKEFADLFRPAFNHDKGNSFMALCKMIEKDYKDDKIKTLYAGFVDYFKAEGDEIAE